MIRVPTGKIRRYFSIKNFTDAFKIIGGILYGFVKMFFIMPDVIFSKGGYGALPASFAAMVYGIPFMVHESDAVPGRVNRFAARFASRIAIAFSGAEVFFPKEKTAFVGVPIRTHLLGANLDAARQDLGISTNFPILGFIGASQGAQKINELVLNSLVDLTREYEIVHQVGAKNFDAVAAESRVILERGPKERYHEFGFLHERELARFYAVCDLVISRASASSIYEIAALGKPSILIPLPNSAQAHQEKNAFEYAATGAALVMEEGNLTPHLLFAEIKKILGDPELMKKMSAAAQKFAKIESAELIAREILKLGMH